MGVGRRFKKQGPPEPLSEEHFARLKRKAGLPTDDVPAEQPSKKKRTHKNDTSTSAKKLKASNKAPKKEKPPEVSSDEIDDLDVDDDDEFGDSDLAENLSDLSDEELGEGLGDDFLDSDDGPSVYDSDEDHQKRQIFSEDEDESDAEEKLTAANIEGLSRKLDQKLAKEAADAEAELQDAALQINIAGDKPRVLDDDEEEDDLLSKTKALLAPDLQLLRTRITDNIRVLDDFANLAEEGRARSEYIDQLLKDICAYYGYSAFLAEKLFNLFTPREAFAFFEANETARPIVIRTNTLRTHRRDLAQALINRGVTLEPVGKWSKIGLQIFESSVPLGATPEYLAGHYILQAASSFLPVMALEPRPHERVLDMAAAPGGKTCHMAAMMNNTGCIFANDPNKARAKGLIGNVHRLGCRNVVVSALDARDFPKVIGGFDRVLLDAPCSGTGVIAKDPSVKTNKSEKDFLMLPHMQKQLLLSAIDSENEQVVQYALSRRPNVKLVETNLPFGKEGFTSYMGKKFDKSLALTRRYYPHSYNVDGFFVAKFQKTGPTPKNAVAVNHGPQKKNGSKSKIQKMDIDGDEEEIVDKTPLVDEDAGDEKQDDDFGGWDDEEDKEYIEKAKKNAMRRRGLDPRALQKKGKGKEKGNKA